MKDINLKHYIDKALKEKFAIGAINFNNMETLQGIITACKNLSSPAIISLSEGAINYMGDSFVKALTKAAKEEYPYLFLHLDHGKTLEICKKAIELGFDSVMIDGSNLSFEKNILLTKKVCTFAHMHNVVVEGELGQLCGIEDNISSLNHKYTDPNKAKEFVEKTGVDMLAVAIGTSHGAFKYNKNPALRFDILSEIEKTLHNFPLVLHGASSVNKSLIDLINSYGGEIDSANGIPIEFLQKLVKEHNIIKINNDTDIRLAITAQVRKTLQENKHEFDLRKYLGAGRSFITQIVEDKIQSIFFSSHKI